MRRDDKILLLGGLFISLDCFIGLLQGGLRKLRCIRDTVGDDGLRRDKACPHLSEAFAGEAWIKTVH